MEKNFKNIILTMHELVLEKKGIPVVAVAFEKESGKIILGKNNLSLNIISKKRKNRHFGHAEWRIMDYFNLKNINSKNINLIITTSPCLFCKNRLINNFEFNKIYFLFEKYFKNEMEYCGLKKYEFLIKRKNEIDDETFKLISFMEDKWIEQNKINNKKSQKKRNENREFINNKVWIKE